MHHWLGLLLDHSITNFSDLHRISEYLYCIRGMNRSRVDNHPMNFPHLRDVELCPGLSPLADGLCLGGGHGLAGHAVHALPQAVGLAHAGLPQPEGAVLAAARIKLPVRRESDAVHGSEVTFEVFNLNP